MIILDTNVLSQFMELKTLTCGCSVGCETANNGTLHDVHYRG